MAQFRYVAKSRTGERQEGSLEAPDKRAVIAQLGRPARISTAPVWLCRLMLALIRPFSYRYWAMGKLLLFMSTHDVCTPRRGTVRLRDYLAQHAAA